MSASTITPLEAWICRKIGMVNGVRLDRRRLTKYQLEALNRTLIHVRGNSSFYRQHLRGLSPRPLSSLDGLAGLPFTTTSDLRRDPYAFLCVSQDRIARAVTLDTTGTTGSPKRLFFTEADLELTVDFFHHGMSTLVSPGQRVLVLLPGTSPGSVGDLLVWALARMSVKGIVHGPVTRPDIAVQTSLDQRIDCLVGIPVQVLAMVCHDQGRRLSGQIQSVLLSTDYVPTAIVRRLKQAWGCRVFKHYGMTEMGLGGAVECSIRNGYHWREADLLMEIVDPQSGLPVADGVQGEIVVTTLTREGMPLIRYRTGDGAALKVDSCPCGTLLKTLDTVKGRLKGMLNLDSRSTLSIGELDEAVFDVEGVLNYDVEIVQDGDIDALILNVKIRRPSGVDELVERIRHKVTALAPVHKAMQNGRLTFSIRLADHPRTISTGVVKRTIIDRRERNVLHEHGCTSGLRPTGKR